MPKKVTKKKHIAVTGKKQGYWVNEENLRKGERTIEIKKDKLKKDKHLVRRYRSGYDYNQIFIGYELTKEDLKQQFTGRKQANPRAAQYDLAIRAKNTQEAPIITAKQFFDFTRADIEGIDTPKTKNEVEFEERVQKLAREIGVKYKDIEWKKMKNIWGQATSTKQLRFNPEVLTKDQKFQDKVIIHELLHLRYPGHSVMQRRMEKIYLNELYPATSTKLDELSNEFTKLHAKYDPLLKEAKTISQKNKLFNQLEEEKEDLYREIEREKLKRKKEEPVKKAEIQLSPTKLYKNDPQSVQHLKDLLKVAEKNHKRMKEEGKPHYYLDNSQARINRIKNKIGELEKTIKKPSTKTTVDRSKSIAAGKNLYLEKYDPKKTHLALTKTMTDMQKRRLIKMCKDNNIDPKELDSALKYDENQEIISHMIELDEEQQRDERAKVEQKIQHLEGTYYGSFSKKRIKERALDEKTTEPTVITEEDIIKKRKKKQLEKWEDEPFLSKIDVEDIDTKKPEKSKEKKSEPKVTMIPPPPATPKQILKQIGSELPKPYQEYGKLNYRGSMVEFDGTVNYLQREKADLMALTDLTSEDFENLKKGSRADQVQRYDKIRKEIWSSYYAAD